MRHNYNYYNYYNYNNYDNYYNYNINYNSYNAKPLVSHYYLIRFSLLGKNKALGQKAFDSESTAILASQHFILFERHYREQTRL